MNEDGDEVGYGKPPKAHRWKKGQSGNPKGRPKRRTLHDFRLHDEMLKALNGTVVITEGGIRRAVPRAEAMVLSLINAAASGKLQAFRAVMETLTELEKAREEKSLFETAGSMTAAEAAKLYQRMIHRGSSPNFDKFLE